MEYKNTLNLPKTDFPMRADLPKREPGMLARWQDTDLYGRLRQAGQGKPKYILHDGPPYANGNIHIGHALNKTLKDIIVKYKSMQGCDAPYIPGWDCHGLPVEHQLFKELGITKYQIGQVEFRKKAHDYALNFVKIQREQFQRLGVFGDWAHPYLTLDPEYEEGIIRAFKTLADKGYIYRGLKPVNWCFKCETALAEAEVEYEDHASPSIYVKFKLDAAQGFTADTYLVVWTTTPWTLLANVAVSVHPDFHYVCVRTGKGNLIIVKDLLDRVLENSGIKEFEILKEYRGRQLEGLHYTHPFGMRSGTVVLAEYVSKEEGTGLVHTAPGHGNEDYMTGVRYKLDIVMPVDAKGIFDNTVGEFSGQHVFSANKPIIEKLQRQGALLFQGALQHSYPHCWRCKSAVIFRATKQWFINIDHEGLRTRLLDVIGNSVEWIPAAGKERISGMVKTRPDWCLSRQRYWGVPIPSVICVGCQEEFLDPAVIENFARTAAQEGTDSWFSREIKDFLPEGFTCPGCRSNRFVKGNDILDVWFDSGVSSQAVLKKRAALNFPANLYLEGSDQHRGWFQSSLIPALCIDGAAPFATVLTHGFVVDAEGRKMSKSLGNVISPFDIIKEYGADLLRLWVASSDYNEDIRISSEILKRLAEAYRKIRNTARFILSNLYDFNPDTDCLAVGGLKKIDAWILSRLQELIRAVTDAYEHFEFYKAYKLTYDFCNEPLSMYYLDMVKGRLYTCGSASAERRAAQTALYEILQVLVRLLAPILSFTADEMWQHLPLSVKMPRPDSVHLSDWPIVNPVFSQQQARGEEDSGQHLDVVFDLIPDIAKALEALRSEGAIGSSFDAQIYLLTNNQNRYTYLDSLRADLLEIFKVSQVSVLKQELPDSAAAVSSAYTDIGIKVAKADGQKCQRCWNYSHAVGTDTRHPELCAACIATLTA